MFHLIKRVIKWGNRTVTIYIGPAEEEKKEPLVKNLGIKIWSLILALGLWFYVRLYAG
tara:strand:+ start:1321 stop:1494 length:174 start_codon:yes stop_codon:yes gene_type:complete